MSRWGAAALGFVLLALGSIPAGADGFWLQNRAVWKAADECARAAIKAFPDYTPESLAKRDAQRRNCLRQARIPVNDPPPRQ